MTALEQKDKKIGPRSEHPDPVDIHVGQRMRLRRNLLGMSQEQLGKALGLTFQQIQKYERGSNRMGASRLYHIAKILCIEVDYFFQNFSDELTILASHPGFAESGQSPLGGAPPSNQNHNDIMQSRETVELVRSYYRIQDPKQRRKIYELVKSMAEES